MRKIAAIGIVGTWTMLSGICSAQMSTFPNPPPLPPPARTASDQSANSPSVTPTNLNVGPGNQSTNNGTPAEFPSGTVTPGAPEANAAGSGIPETAETLTSMSALDDKNTLQPGDRISFRVIEDRDPAVPRIVTDTGEVDFPYVGRIKVEGLTCHQVAVELKRLLEVDYYKSATVIVGLDVIADHEKTVQHDYVWVVGQVRSVGPQEIFKLQPMTVSQTILRAGGFADFADQRKVRIIHRSSLSSGTTNSAPSDDDSQKGQIVDVKAVFDGSSTFDPIVQPNDYIIVPKKFINF